MNQEERYKVNRKRTLQAILRGYWIMKAPVSVEKLCYRFEVPNDFSYRGLASAIMPIRRRWQPRRIGTRIYNITLVPAKEPYNVETGYTLSWDFNKDLYTVESVINHEDN